MLTLLDNLTIYVIVLYRSCLACRLRFLEASPSALGGAMKRKERGFTLVEIAIVLVIIGLLLGGIL